MLVHAIQSRAASTAVWAVQQSTWNLGFPVTSPIIYIILVQQNLLQQREPQFHCLSTNHHSHPDLQLKVGYSINTNVPVHPKTPNSHDQSIK